MPHIILEHSANVSDVADMAGLVVVLHHAALATGIAPSMRCALVPHSATYMRSAMSTQ